MTREKASFKRFMLISLFVLASIAVWAAAPTFRKASANSAKWPAEPSAQLSYSGKLRIDLSNSSEGYFLAALNSANKHKMKMRVTKGGTTLTYDLNGNADFEVFPFQLGSGFYEIALFENISGKKYAQAGVFGINVNLSREDGAFLYPNQYVNYTPLSKAVEEAEKLCAGKTELEAYKILCSYMASTFVYDFVKSVTVKPGTLPDIDGCFGKRMGVCQDLSAILCCMLRTQGLPARLIIGYADKQYHAWTLTTIDGKDYFFDPTAALNAINKVKDYSVERFY